MSWVVYDESKARAAGAGEDNEILYVTQVGDLIAIFENRYGEGSWDELDERTRHLVKERARSYMENFCGGGVYNWDNALTDAIRDLFDEAQVS